MMHFEHPLALWLLVPIALVAFWMARPGKASAVAYSHADLVRAIATPRRTKWGRFLPTLRWLGAALLAVALARPTFQRTNAQVSTSGVDIMLAVDVSGSMQARDMRTATAAPAAAPSSNEQMDSDAPAAESDPRKATAVDVSRLDAAKAVVGSFIDARPNDRIGLVAFAGQPYLASPLTLDHDAVLTSLAGIDTNQVSDGTAIGSAIATGVRRLDAQNAKSKVLIVLTDGQNNAGKIQPTVAAEAAKALGIKIYTIGVGSTGQAMVPVTDEHGRKVLVAAKVDVDEAGLKKVAEETGGTFFRATDTASLRDVYASIDSLEKTTRTLKSVTEHDERFAWFAVPGLFLVLGELGLSATRFRRVPA